MKRLFSVLILIVALIFVSCKGDNKDLTKDNDPGIEKILEIAKNNMDTRNMVEETDKESIQTFFEVSPDNYEAFKFMMPDANIKVSEIVIFKAKDGNLDAVKKGLKAHLDNNLEIFSSYLPDQYEILKKAELFDKGNYSILLVGKGADKAKEEILKAFN